MVQTSTAPNIIEPPALQYWQYRFRISARTSASIVLNVP